MTRATEAIINLHALGDNYQLAKQQAPNARAYAVLKANAYGHGLETVAKFLSKIADGIAVACMDEAAQLRQAGILLPILVMQGPYSLAETQEALDLDLELAIHREEQVQWLETLEQGSASVWIKVDTGMHRLGFAVEDVPAIVSRLRNHPRVSKLQLMSHFGCADEIDHPLNRLQLQRMATLSPLGLPTSFCNSAGIQTLPEAHGDMVRPGIMLYGAAPLIGQRGPDAGLLPVMTLQSEIIALKQLHTGEGVGYGQSWSAQKPCVIATVAIGYGDGYPRHAKNGTPVLIHGQKVPLVGRVSMDMLTCDVTQLDHVAVGDKVTLWGTGLPADEIADYCDTIAYELFCQVTQRVRVRYLGAR